MDYRISLPCENFMQYLHDTLKLNILLKIDHYRGHQGIKLVRLLFVMSVDRRALSLSWVLAPSSVHALHCDLLPEFPGKRARLVGSTQVVLEWNCPFGQSKRLRSPELYSLACVLRLNPALKVYIIWKKQLFMWLPPEVLFWNQPPSNRAGHVPTYSFSLRVSLGTGLRGPSDMRLLNTVRAGDSCLVVGWVSVRAE